MNFKKPSFRTIVILALLFFFPIIIFAATPLKDQIVLNIILNSLRSQHYSPKPINDDFSKSVFVTFIKQLDPYKQFFIQEDIDALKQYENDIDNELNEQSFEFYNAAIQKFLMRVNDIKKFYPELLKTPFDFTKNEYIETNADKLKYAANVEELKEVWRKQLKSRTLSTYFELVQNKEKITIFDPKIELKSRQKQEKDMKNLLERLLKNKDNYKDQYINVITGVFDPHSDYFPPEEKENFDIGMSGTLEGIGAMLSEEDGFIKVASIVPGGPAYREKELEAEDKILKVAEGKGEPVDIISMQVQEAIKFIRGKKGTEVRLTVKKPDGRILIIPIIRDIVVIEETFAKSCLIKDKKSHKTYGYILLPKFYRDFNDEKARNSTDDMLKELQKLTKNNVDGIILDLRNNSGGSLRDAVDIGGLFIKTGPMVQVKKRDGSTEVLSDDNPLIAYKGPMIVLINKFSASASEILAAAMQDHHRAVIVGTSSSFGKGSVQSFIDLDNYIKKNYNYLQPLGSLKMTIQLFFRINGDAIQFKGVAPDITLPDTYNFLDIGEKKLPYALDFCTVNAAVFTPYKVTYKVETLKAKDKKRVAGNPVFNKIISYGKILTNKQSHTLIPLNFNTAKTEQLELKKASTQLKNLQKENPALVLTILDKNNASKITNKEWLKQIKKDIYIEDAVNILNDI